MPDKNIFCNAPWYELQIYWDGSLGFCCQEYHKIYPESQSEIYNIKNMTIREWFDSEPMRQARMSMFGKDSNSICHWCYFEEDHSSTSRRHRCNQKSVIFTRSAFLDSYLQSPGYNKFENSRSSAGAYDGMPIDLHIDLGNYCNLSCKMCKPKASSQIASQYIKWGIEEARPYLRSDWTKDQIIWDRVLNELADIPQLKNVHFMGGETLITKRFEDFVDFMLDRGRTDLHFSFVTNGTTFNQKLLDKLKRFKRVGIEVSIESLNETNAYQRQGTDQKLVMQNIDRYLSHCDGGQITLTIRPAISLLTVGSYVELLEWCLNHNLVVKSLVVTTPDYLSISILPTEIKQLYISRYQRLIDRYSLGNENIARDYNESDPHQIRLIIKNQIDQCMNLLSTPCPDNTDDLCQKLISWCKRWDKVFGYDAIKIYPELVNLFEKYGYNV